MNERIRELSAIAKHLSTDEAIHLSRVHNRTLSLDEEQEIFTEKFAELIVRECIQVAVNKGSGYMHTADVAGYMAAGRSTAAQMIREHFGVES